MHLIALVTVLFFPLAPTDGPIALTLAAQQREEGIKSICPIF